MKERKKVIIHDLPDILSERMFSSLGSDFVVINANAKAAGCIGCFKCWLKTPGVCGFSDKLQDVGPLVLSSKELIIITEMLYGGLSVPVKKIIDRSIPGITPFFKKRFNKLHHLQRYKTQTNIKAIFYNTENITEEEKIHSQNYIDAMGINYHSEHNDVLYLKDMDFSGVSLWKRW